MINRAYPDNYLEPPEEKEVSSDKEDWLDIKNNIEDKVKSIKKDINELVGYIEKEQENKVDKEDVLCAFEFINEIALKPIINIMHNKLNFDSIDCPINLEVTKND